MNEKEQKTTEQNAGPESASLQAAYFKIFGLPGLLYATVYTICMFQNDSGITMPVWIAATILYACVTMRQISAAEVVKKMDTDKEDTGNGASVRQDWRLRAGSWFYITVMMLLGIATFLTDQTAVIWMNYIGFFTMLLLFLLHHFYNDRQWDFTKNIAEMIIAVFGAVGCMMVPFLDGYAFFKERKTTENKTVRAVLTGLLLAVPGLLIVGFCLMCADAVFETMILRLLDGMRMPATILKVAGMLLFGFFSSYCGMRYLIRRSQIPMERRQPVFDPVIAITFTGLFLVMYAVFCGVQTLYLFAASMRLPNGMTYAQYAHRGFYMLLFVCLLNFVLVLVTRKYFERHRILNVMLLLICGCTFVMLASSAYRMYLYISVYQLTFLRVFVLAALLTLAFLLAGAMAVVLKPDFLLVRYSLVVVSTIYLCLAFAHADRLIASYNLSHAQEHAANMDWQYLSQLSLDAAPAVERYYRQASLEAKKQMDAGARLAQAVSEGRWGSSGLEEMDIPMETYWYAAYMRKVYQAKSNMGVRNFNVSRYRAVQILTGR